MVNSLCKKNEDHADTIHKLGFELKDIKNESLNTKIKHEMTVVAIQEYIK
jgi:hypothetical protein